VIPAVDLAALKALIRPTTSPLPWRPYELDPWHIVVDVNGETVVGNCDGVEDEDDLALIVAAVNALPELLALAGTCSCYDGNPDNYEGQRADCPVHGSVRAYAEASAEVERLRAERDRARTAVHRYMGHRGEVDGCNCQTDHTEEDEDDV